MNSIPAFVTALLLFAADLSSQDTVRTNPNAAPAWGSSVRLVHEFSIGALDGPKEYAFGRIAYVASTTDGRFFLYDSQDSTARRYDAAGKFLGQMGRGGAGPGEFTTVNGMGVIGDSLVAFFDTRASRITLYSVEGQFRRSFNISVGGSFFGGKTFWVEPSGAIALRGPMPRGPNGEPPSKWVRFKIDGTRIDSVVLPADIQIKQQFSVGNRSSFGERKSIIPSPLGTTVTWWSAPYRFVISDRGRTTLVERPYTPVPLNRAERAEWQVYAERLRNVPRADGRGPDVYEIPDRKPAIRSVDADAFGRIWVEVYVAAKPPSAPQSPSNSARLTWLEPTTYDVFESTGRYLGRIELPARASIASIQRDKLWLLTTGSGDQQVVAVYRIE